MEIIMKKFNINGVFKLTYVLSIIIEIIYWIGAAANIIIIICSFFARDWFNRTMTSYIFENSADISLYGCFYISIAGADNSVNMTAYIVYLICSTVMSVIFALIYRYIYLILKTAEGKTRFSDGNTPFQKSIVRMLRRIGALLISIPVTAFIFDIISFFIGIDNAYSALSYEHVIIGLFIICIAQYFSRGAALKEKTDGLI